MTPSVRAIAALLTKVDPESLARLRVQFPDQKRLFDPTFVLGDEQPLPVQSKEITALRSFSEVGLAAAERTLQKLVTALSGRIRLARSVKLAGSIMASVSSVGVISALALKKEDTALITAFIALISSVAALVGEHLDKPLVGNQKSLADLLGDALSAESKARDLHTELLSGAFEATDSVLAFATKVNEVAASVRAIMVYGGISAD
jgi:hypothetical protein